MTPPETERLVAVEVRLEELRDQVREARADVRSLDAKIDTALRTLVELQARPGSDASTGTQLSTKGLAGMTAGLSTLVAVAVEVIQHFVTRAP